MITCDARVVPQDGEGGVDFVKGEEKEEGFLLMMLFSDEALGLDREAGCQGLELEGLLNEAFVAVEEAGVGREERVLEDEPDGYLEEGDGEDEEEKGREEDLEEEGFVAETEGGDDEVEGEKRDEDEENIRRNEKGEEVGGVPLIEEGNEIGTRWRREHSSDDEQWLPVCFSADQVPLKATRLDIRHGHAIESVKATNTSGKISASCLVLTRGRDPSFQFVCGTWCSMSEMPLANEGRGIASLVSQDLSNGRLVMWEATRLGRREEDAIGRMTGGHSTADRESSSEKASA